GRTYPTGSPGNAAPQARQEDTRQAAFPGERLWRLYLVGTLLALPTIAKLGASSNYWLELTAASAAALALASHRLAVWPLARPLAPTIVAGALLVAVPRYQATHVEGLWSEQPILDAINARRFSLVALMHPLDGPALGTRWTPAVHKALNSAYTPAGVEAGFWLYRPRGY